MSATESVTERLAAPSRSRKPPSSPSGILRWAAARSVLSWQLTIGVILILLWEWAGRTYPRLVPTVSEVIGGFGYLATHYNIPASVGTSLRTLIVGWLVAMVVGVLIGLLLGRYQRLAWMFEPFLNAFYATPRIALVPLMVLWFGLNFRAMVATVVLITVFPVLIMTLTGVRNAGREYLEVARSFCLGEGAILVKVILPGALPYIATGLKLASGRAVTGMFVAELYIHSEGLGKLLQESEDALAMDRVMGVTIIISVIAILASSLVTYVERRLQFGRPQAFE